MRRPRRISLRSIALTTGVLVLALGAVVAFEIVYSFLKIVWVAEGFRHDVVPMVLDDQQQAMTVSDLARLVDGLVYENTGVERRRALVMAESLRAAIVRTHAGAAARHDVDAALTSIRRIASFADMRDENARRLTDALKRARRRVKQALTAQTRSAASRGALVEWWSAAAEAQWAGDVAALERLRDRAAAARLQLPSSLAKDLADIEALFAIGKDDLRIRRRLAKESRLARRSLDDLIHLLTSDARTLAQRNAADILRMGRRGVVLSAVTLTAAFGAVVVLIVFLLRHVVGPILRVNSALGAINAGNRGVVLAPLLLTEIDGIRRSVEHLATVLDELSDKEKATQRNQRQLEFIFDASPAPFLMTDLASSAIMRINKAACVLLRRQRDALIGSDARDLWADPDRRAEFLAYLEQSGAADNVDVNLRDGHGRTIWTLLSARVIAVGGDKRVLIGLHDITDRRAYEARLHQLVSELEGRNRDLAQFATTVAHGLEAPLRSVRRRLMVIDARNRGDLTDNGRASLDRAAGGVRKIERRLGGLLEYAQAGGEARLEPVPIRNPLEQALNGARGGLEAIGGATEVVGGDPVVLASEASLLSVFRHLLDNALQYRSPDRPLKIRISFEETDGACAVSVRDNGLGVPPRHSERVFHIFQRVEGRANRMRSGVGLAVCRKLVEQLGGAIAIVQDAPPHRDFPQGCCVRFSLHLARLPPPV